MILCAQNVSEDVPLARDRRDGRRDAERNGEASVWNGGLDSRGIQHVHRTARSASQLLRTRYDTVTLTA